MRFKTLKHKTIEGAFGHIMEVSPFIEKGGGRKEDVPAVLEIAYGEIPRLQPMTADIELMIEIYRKEKQSDVVLSLMEDYELVVIDLKIII